MKRKLKTRPNLTALISFVTFLLMACGGGGGSSAGPSGISETYYPTTQNSIWAYEVTDSDHSDTYFNTIKISGTKTVSGVNAIVFKEDNSGGSGVPVENYYYKDARAFTFFGTNDPSDWINPLVVPYDEMRFDGTFSSPPLIQRSGINIGTDLDGDGKNELLDIYISGTVEGYETLTTTAGTFLNAARLKISITGTLRLSRGGKVPIAESVTEWRAPGVGMVKQTSSVSVNGIVSNSTVNIHGYAVGSLKGGYLAPQTLVSNLVLQADSSLDRPGRHAVGSDGNNFLIVGRQETGMRITSPLSKWFGQIVSADGTSQVSFDLSPSTDRRMGEAAVAFDGTNYLVLTDTTTGISGSTPFNGITGQRVSAAGVVIDSFPGITISATGINPSVAFGGGSYLVAYRNFSGTGGIYGVLVSPAGIIGSEFPISTSTADVGFPAVAFDGSNFLVVWESGGTQSDPSTTDIYGARVSPSGVVVDSTAIAIATAPEAQISPQVACDETNCMVAWIDRINYPGYPYNYVPLSGDVYAAFLSKDGVLLSGTPTMPGIPIAIGIEPLSVFPGLVFTGSEYLVTWTQYTYVGPRGILGARVSTSGSISGDTIALSGVPDYGSTLIYSSIAMSQNGALVTWLNNSTMSGTSKGIEGALAFP